MATKVIVEALRKANFRWVSRQEVRDAARAYIGDTGLLDFVLKSLGNHVVGNYLVRRTVNPVTKVLEYCLEDDISNTFCNEDGFSPSNSTTRSQITRDQIMNDMFYLLKSIFTFPRPTTQTTGIFSMISIATRMILDAKYLVKDYKGELYGKFEVGEEESLKLLCSVSLKNNEGMNKALPPYNVISLPSHATFRELKQEVERSFKETYWGLKSFAAESVIDVQAKDLDLVFGVVEPDCNLVVAGRIADKEIDIEEIYQNRSNNRFIDCSCGAKEDDGERLITCDICEDRQHNRCTQIPNTEDVPYIFLCSRCEQEIVHFPVIL